MAEFEVTATRPEDMKTAPKAEILPPVGSYRTLVTRIAEARQNRDQLAKAQPEIVKEPGLDAFTCPTGTFRLSAD